MQLEDGSQQIWNEKIISSDQGIVVTVIIDTPVIPRPFNSLLLSSSMDVPSCTNADILLPEQCSYLDQQEALWAVRCFRAIRVGLCIAKKDGCRKIKVPLNVNLNKPSQKGVPSPDTDQNGTKSVTGIYL